MFNIVKWHTIYNYYYTEEVQGIKYQTLRIVNPCFYDLLSISFTCILVAPLVLIVTSHGFFKIKVSSFSVMLSLPSGSWVRQYSHARISISVPNTLPLEPTLLSSHMQEAGELGNWNSGLPQPMIFASSLTIQGKQSEMEVSHVFQNFTQE